MTTPPYECRIYACVRHPHRPGLMLTVGGDLPSVTLDRSVYKGQDVGEALGRVLSLDLNPLRRVAGERLPDGEDGTRRAQLAFDIEVLGGDVDAHTWTEVDTLAPTLDGFPRTALDAAVRPATALRQAWQVPGWRARTLGWLDDLLRERGAERTGAPDLLHAWQISVLYRVPTTLGAVYLKGVPPFFARETRLAPWLHTRFPHLVPDVLAADSERRLLVLHDAGTVPDGDHADLLAIGERTFAHLAELQRGLVPYARDLLKIGCLARPSRDLPDELDALLDDPALLGVGESWGLTDDDVDALRALQPAVRDASRRLEAAELPASLVHSDLHRNNVVRSGADLRILDWTDGALGHPFLDARPTYFLFDDDLPAADARRLTDAYLAGWEGVAPESTLRDALDAAQPLGEIHAALGYARHILPGVEDRTEWAHAVPFHLRQLRRKLEGATAPAASR